MFKRVLIVFGLVAAILLSLGQLQTNSQAINNYSPMPELQPYSWGKVLEMQYNAQDPEDNLNAQAFARFASTLAGVKLQGPVRTHMLAMANNPKTGFGWRGLDGMRWLIAVCTLAVERLQHRLEQMEREISALRKENEELKAWKAEIESLLTTLESKQQKQ